MVEKGYILESELMAYAMFMRVLVQLAHYFESDWLQFLRVERDLRIYQFESGCPWDTFGGMLNPLIITLAAGSQLLGLMLLPVWALGLVPVLRPQRPGGPSRVVLGPGRVLGGVPGPVLLGVIGLPGPSFLLP
jgi:hypothetical protein